MRLGSVIVLLAGLSEGHLGGACMYSEPKL